MRVEHNKNISPLSRAIILLSVILMVPALATGNTFMRMQTDLGAIDIELFDSTPLTRDNFLNYVNDGDYDSTFFHRSVPGFVVQGGGYLFDGPDGSFFTGGAAHIPTDPPVVNEFGLLNIRGTIAMAKLGGDPDSATSEWFFNLVDNDFLDTVEGGLFTVFAQVLGNGMEVVDAIAALQRCEDVIAASECGSFPETPFVDVTQAPANKTLVNINYIGVDTDGDGAIDKVEDAAPNSGDGNNDLVADSLQPHVASFPWSSGEYVVLESPPGNPLQFLNILGETFILANPPSPEINDESDFFFGLAGFDLPVPAGGGPVTLTVTLPAGDLPNTYYNFSPTIDDPSPHWYEFMYDAATGTGAIIDNNVVTLYFVDGERGDADLDDTNGNVSTLGGPAVDFDLDEDGVLNSIEDGAPNGGDGNNDGIADSEQAHVGSLTDVYGDYITVVADSASLELRSLQALDADLGLALLLTAEPQDILNGRNFPHGFVSFDVANAVPGGSFVIKLILPENERPVSYLKYGPTPDNPLDHLYEFLYDGETGAEFDGNMVILHFVDGERGDSDLLANGEVSDPGAPAIRAPVTGSGGGGSSGCSLGSSGSGPWQGGAWWLLLVMLVVDRLRTRTVRYTAET